MQDHYTIGNEFNVKRIGFGTMRLTSGEGKWGPPKDKNEAIRLLKKAVDIGIDFFDTADMYGPGISEEIIAEALYPYKDTLISTKGGNEISGPKMVVHNCSPDHLRKAVHDSLKRLKLDSIDLYQLHTIDPKIDIEFSVEELSRLKEEGKIRHIGLSNIDMPNLIRAQKVVKVSSVQNKFNFLSQNALEIVNYTNAQSIAFLSYYPLAKGELSKFDVLPNLYNNLTLSQKALIWQLNLSPNIIPIQGTTSEAHLIENFKTLSYFKNETT